MGFCAGGAARLVLGMRAEEGEMAVIRRWRVAARASPRWADDVPSLFDDLSDAHSCLHSNSCLHLSRKDKVLSTLITFQCMHSLNS